MGFLEVRVESQIAYCKSQGQQSGDWDYDYDYD